MPVLTIDVNRIDDTDFAGAVVPTIDGWVECSAPIVLDPSGNAITVGDGALTFNASGVASASLLPTTGDTNPPEFQYQVHLRYTAASTGQRSKVVKTWRSGWFSLTADANLVDLPVTVLIPPAFSGAIPAAEKGAPGGVAPLDPDGLLPEANVPQRLTEAALTDTLVTRSSLVPLPSAIKFKRDTLTATETAAGTLTLGATPATDSEQVSINGTAIYDYTLDGDTISIDSLTAGDVIRVRYAYTGPDAADAALGQGFVISDSFDRADDATSLGVADTGQAWVAQRGTWGISGNQAYMAVVASANDSAVIDTGISDCTVQVKVAAVGGSMGLTVRASDADNAITTNLTGLYRRTAGANALLASFSEAFVAGDTMQIRCEGDTLTVYRQAASAGAFTQVATVVETQGQTVTTHGFRQSGDTSSSLRFDDFKVTAL